MKNNESNTDFLTRIMEFSAQGAIMQMFVMQALISYTEHVIDNEEKVREQMEHSFIHPDAWISAAKGLKKELDLRMPPHKKG